MTAPKILVFHTRDWPNAARLALAFAQHDCRVFALCRASNPLARLRVVEQSFRYATWSDLFRLQQALAAAAPDLVVPCDDIAVAALHRLYRRDPEAPAARLIARSLGRPECFAAAASRTGLPPIASAAGIRLPPTLAATDEAALAAWFAAQPGPAVVKFDGTTGGRGVFTVHSLAEARGALNRERGLQGAARLTKRLLCERDAEPLARRLRCGVPPAILQRFVEGRPANCAVACWQGSMLAGFAVEPLAMVRPPTGTATVVRRIDHPEILETASRIVGQLGLSGFCGFDFVIDRAGAAWLIEINPRATQLNHLPLGPGRDLVAALRAALTGDTLREAPAATPLDTIALFPQELRRDRASPFLAAAYHDVPADAPELLRAYPDAAAHLPAVSFN